MRRKDKENEKSATMAPLAMTSNRQTSPAMKLVLPVVLLAVIALISLAVIHGVNRLYRKNPAFLLSRIDIVAPTDALRDSANECLRSQNVLEGMVTITELDLRSLRAELLKNPRVATAELQRVFPGTLRVTIKPRVPVAILRFPPASGMPELKIDQEGYVLPFDLPGVTSSLPRITGIQKPENFVVGKKTEDDSVLAFLTFLKLCALRADGANYEVFIAKLDTNNEKMTLMLEANEPFRQSAQLVLPTTNLPAHLDRVGIVVELRRERNQSISYLNATYTNIPVRP